MVVEFEVRGKPVPKARARVVELKDPNDRLRRIVGAERKKRFHAFTPPRTQLYETTIKGLALVARQEAKARPFTGPVGVKVIVRPQLVTIRVYDLPMPSRCPPDASTHLSMPCDLDNILKAILDALSGILYRDDRQVEKISVEFQSVSEKFAMVQRAAHKMSSDGP